MPCVVLLHQELEAGLFPESAREHKGRQEVSSREAEDGNRAGQTYVVMGQPGLLSLAGPNGSMRCPGKQRRKGRKWKENPEPGRREDSW